MGANASPLPNIVGTAAIATAHHDVGAAGIPTAPRRPGKCFASTHGVGATGMKRPPTRRPRLSKRHINCYELGVSTWQDCLRIHKFRFIRLYDYDGTGAFLPSLR
jgi:hypothetical protein